MSTAKCLISSGLYIWSNPLIVTCIYISVVLLLLDLLILGLTVCIVPDGPKSFVGWINEIQGIIAAGESKEEVKSELFKILGIKFEMERERKPVEDLKGMITERFDLSCV